MDNSRRLVTLARRLLSLQLLVIIGAGLVATSTSYYLGYQEAIEHQDETLTQLAKFVYGQRDVRHRAIDAASVRLGDERARIFLLPLSELSGSLGREEALNSVSGSTGIPATVKIGGQAFRVVSTRDNTGANYIVAQSIDYRSDIASESALTTLVPLAIFLPFLMGAVFLSVRRVASQVRHTADEIGRRAIAALLPVNGVSAPAEVQPLIDSINVLIARVNEVVERNERFVATAAHELRTPIAALMILTEELSKTTSPNDFQVRSKKIAELVERTAGLMDQVLQLGGAQNLKPKIGERSNLFLETKHVVETLLPIATEREVGFLIDISENCEIAIGALSLNRILRNLVENAIKHGVRQGVVSICAVEHESLTVLHVDNPGEPIPPEKRANVLAPFAKLNHGTDGGAGLGLAIVSELLQRYGATIDIAFLDEVNQTGTRVTLTLPAVSFF